MTLAVQCPKCDKQYRLADQFAGKRVKLRFRAGFDEAAGILNGYTGWYIDDIQVTAVLYSCGQSQAASVEVTSTENSRTARPPRRGLQRIE